MSGTLPPPPPPPPPPPAQPRPSPGAQTSEPKGARGPLSDEQILELLRSAGESSTAINEARDRTVRLVLLCLGSVGLIVIGLRLLFPAWEYRVETLEESRFERELSRLGQGGWELVTARRQQPSPDGRTPMIFKRRRLF